MATTMHGPANMDSAPFQPLQSYHSHLYSSTRNQGLRSIGRNSGINLQKQEKLTKPSKRPAKKLDSEPPSSNDIGSVRRRSSRLGVFSLFGRSKSTESEESSEVKLESTQESPEELDEPIQPADAFLPFTQSPNLVSDAFEDINPSPSVRQRASRKTLRPEKSFSKDKSSTKKMAHWTPPPLYQAYPQAIKYATLQAPTITPESLMRMNEEKQALQAKLLEEGDDEHMSKKEREKKLRKASALDLISAKDWTEKVYVLVTEGHLLQYAGAGPYDRQIEKIMPLCKDSAAFASDAIPGRPFVLQISQISGEDGAVDADISKALLRKAGLSNKVKHSATSYLLVLKDPKEMNDWLVAVRKQIELLGGKVYNPEVFGTDGMVEGQGSESDPSLQRMPSHRYLVKRDPRRFSPEAIESPPAVVSADAVPLSTVSLQADHSEAVTSTNAAPASATQSSTVSPYESNTHSSIAQFQLDQLKASPRQSCASTVARTPSTSRSASPQRDSVIDRRLSSDVASPAAQNVPVITHQSVLSDEADYNGNRDTDQATPTPSSRPRSVLMTPVGMRAASPGTPNFSVPTFSKRYSMNSASSAASVKGQSPGSSAGVDSAFQKPPPLRTGSVDSAAADFLPSTMNYRPMSSSRASKRLSQHSGRVGTPPRSADSKEFRASVDGDHRFSRRLSSLEHARGTLPLPPPLHTPSPHPPPTAALPPLPIPSPEVLRTSSASPLSVGMASIPTPEEPQMFAPPTVPIPALPKAASTSSMPPVEETVVKSPSKESPRKLRRPASMQARLKPTMAMSELPPLPRKEDQSRGLHNHANPLDEMPGSWPAKQEASSTASNVEAPTPTPAVPTPTPAETPSVQEGPKPPTPSKSPIQQAKASITQSSQTSSPSRFQLRSSLSRKSMPRLLGGQKEPLPVFTISASPAMPAAQNTPSSTTYQPSQSTDALTSLTLREETSTQPHLPPIRLSNHRRSRGSLDGPWNANYAAQNRASRAYLDLSAM